MLSKISKKIISLVLIFSLMSAYFTVHAESNILFSESFTKYADNDINVTTVEFKSGVDTRVINDNGNKALFSRALEGPAKINVVLPASTSNKSVFSAKIKTTGALTSAKWFTGNFGGTEYAFLSVDSEGHVKLGDGRIVGGAPRNMYKQYTIVVDWTKQKFDLYIGEKRVAANWKLPKTLQSFPSQMSWSLDYIDAESCLYIDDIRVYEGEALPWKLGFPVEKENTSVIDFTPTVIDVNTESEILVNLDFAAETRDIAWVDYTGGEGVSYTADDEGISFMSYQAPASLQHNSFFDLTCAPLETKNKYVIETCFRANSMPTGATLGLFDGFPLSGNYRSGFSASGGIIRADVGGTVVGNYVVGEWTKFSVIYNVTLGYAKVYVNGINTAQLSISTEIFPVKFRVDCQSKKTDYSVSFDYLRVYTGTELLEDDAFFIDPSEEEVQDTDYSVMDSPEMLDAALYEKMIFMPGNKTMYLDGEKQACTDDTASILENGEVMVPEKVITRITDKEVKRGDDGSILIGESIIMQVGKKEYTSGGAQNLLDVAPIEKNGILYFPLKNVAEQIMKKCYFWDERGYAVLSETPLPEVDYDLFYPRRLAWNYTNLIYRHMQFDHPTGEQMLADMQKRFPNKQHPRLLFTADDIDYILDKIETEEEWKKAYQQAIADAEYVLNTNVSNLANTAANSKNSTTTVTLLNIEKLAIAFLLSGNSEYADKGIEIMMGLAAWPTADWERSELIFGKYSATLAIGYDAFYSYMMSTAEGREKMKTIREAAVRNIFDVNVKRYMDEGGPRWITMQDNFLGVIGGGIMALLCVMADEEDVQDKSLYLMPNVLKSLEIVPALLYPNGGYFEGNNYVRTLLDEVLPFALAGMHNCFGTDYGLGSAKGFVEGASFITHTQSPYMAIGFHDGLGSSVFQNDSVCELFGYLYNDAVQAAEGRKQKMLAGVSYDIPTLFWYTKTMEKAENEIDLTKVPDEKYFYGAEAGAFISSREVSDATFVGFHGGWTGLPHDMLDVGQFVFGSDNVVWAADLGADSYNVGNYFHATEGYKIYRKRTEGENCVVLNPQVDVENYYGQKIGARVQLIDIDMNKPRGAKAAYDLSSAYERDASKYIRGYYFGDDRNSLIVQDEIELLGKTEIYWFMHTAQTIEIIDNNKARLVSPDGTTCIVDVYCDAPTFTLKEMEAAPLPTSPVVEGQNKNIGYRKLAIHIPEKSGKVNISVKLSPENGKYSYTPLQFKPISEWVIPEGEVDKFPFVTELYVDGVKQISFTKGMKLFTVDLPYGTKVPPQITAECDYGTLAITQAATTDDVTKITLTDPNGKTQIYKVKFNVPTEKPIYITDARQDKRFSKGAKGTPIKHVSYSGKTNPEVANGPDKMIDGDFATRYAQSGIGIWFELDLGEVMDIAGVSLAYYLGDQRSNYIELLYSEDGTNYKRVYKGQSTGATAEYESIEIPGRARYIRLIGNGNSAGNDWVSVTEFRAFK